MVLFIVGKRSNKYPHPAEKELKKKKKKRKANSHIPVGASTSRVFKNFKRIEGMEDDFGHLVERLMDREEEVVPTLKSVLEAGLTDRFSRTLDAFSQAKEK